MAIDRKYPFDSFIPRPLPRFQCHMCECRAVSNIKGQLYGFDMGGYIEGHKMSSLCLSSK